MWVAMAASWQSKRSHLRDNAEGVLDYRIKMPDAVWQPVCLLRDQVIAFTSNPFQNE